MAMRTAGKIALAVGAVAVLAGVFAMYLRPEFLVDLSNQVWACF
jgi:hypothetical protein